LLLLIEAKLLCALGYPSCSTYSLIAWKSVGGPSATIRRIHLDVRVDGRIRWGLLFGAVLSVPLAELLLARQFIALQCLAVVRLGGVCRATFRLLLEASLASFSAFSL